MTLQKRNLERQLTKIHVDTKLKPTDLIMPVSVVNGEHVREKVPHMPGIYRYSLDTLLEEINDIYQKGLRAIILSGPTINFTKNIDKDYDEDSLLQKAIRNIKQMFPALGVIAVLDIDWLEGQNAMETALNEQNRVNLFIRIASTYAEAGADSIIPCHLPIKDLGALREGLDEAGFASMSIVSDILEYESDFCSDLNNPNLHSPTKKLQMSDIKKALMSANGVEDTADALLLQPAIPLLDIIHQVSRLSYLPVLAFQVGAEYASLRLAIDQNVVSDNAIYEILLSIKRAGADRIITYFAKDVIKYL